MPSLEILEYLVLPKFSFPKMSVDVPFTLNTNNASSNLGIKPTKYSKFAECSLSAYTNKDEYPCSFIKAMIFFFLSRIVDSLRTTGDPLLSKLGELTFLIITLSNKYSFTYMFLVSLNVKDIPFKYKLLQKT